MLHISDEELDLLEANFIDTPKVKEPKVKEHVLVRIDKETGEYLEEYDISVNTEVKLSEPQSELDVKRGIAQAIAKSELDSSARFSKENGGHVHMYYIKDKLLLDNKSITPQDKARLIYLSTFLEYNYKENTNLLIIQENAKVSRPMTRADIIELLNLSESTYKRFIKSMKDNKLINEVNKRFFLSKEYFTRGKVDKKILKTHEYTRIYRRPTQLLFENSNATEHKTIGDVLSLLPYLNYDYNHLENSDGSYMTVSDICNMLGYKSDNKNISRQFKKFRDLKFTYCGAQHFVMSKAVLNDTEERIYINPILTYKGNDTLEIKEVIKKLMFSTSQINNMLVK